MALNLLLAGIGVVLLIVGIASRVAQVTRMRTHAPETKYGLFLFPIYGTYNESRAVGPAFVLPCCHQARDMI